MGQLYGSLLPSFKNDINNDDLKCDDSISMEFIIDYKCQTVITSVYYQYLAHLITCCDEPDSTKYPNHCRIKFNVHKLNGDKLYTLTHLLFNERIVCLPFKMEHKIMDYKNNTIRIGKKKKDYNIIQRNNIKYYSHPKYDEEYDKILQSDSSSLFTFEFGMLLQEISRDIFQKYNINISTSIKANKLPEWDIMSEKIRKCLITKLRNNNRKISIQTFINKSVKEAKNIINSCINQYDFESVIDDNNVLKLLEYTNKVKGYIKVDRICEILPNVAIKLLSFYERALKKDGWTKNDIKKLYKKMSKKEKLYKTDISDIVISFHQYDNTLYHNKSICKNWLNGNCTFHNNCWSKPCDYAHGLNLYYIIRAMSYSMNIDYLCKNKRESSKKWSNINEENDAITLKHYENKINNIDKYITEKDLKNIYKYFEKKFVYSQCILNLIFYQYLKYPDGCTPDIFYPDGQQPIIKQQQIAFIDNKGFCLVPAKNSYNKLYHKKYSQRNHGNGIWRLWMYVIPPPGINLDVLIDGIPMTKCQFITALNQSIDINKSKKKKKKKK